MENDTEEAVDPNELVDAGDIAAVIHAGGEIVRAAQEAHDLEECSEKLRDCTARVESLQLAAVVDDERITDVADELADMIAAYERCDGHSTSELSSAQLLLDSLIPEDAVETEEGEVEAEVGRDEEEEKKEEEEGEEGGAMEVEEDAGTTTGGFRAGTTTKERKAGSFSYARLHLDVTLLWTAWHLYFRCVCLYYLSQQTGFSDKFPDFGADGAVNGWDADFVSSMDQLRGDAPSEAFDAAYTSPEPPFPWFEAVEWGRENFPGFKYHWNFFDTEVRLCVEPFDAITRDGNVLPLYNSFVARAALFIYAERSKLARVELCYLWRLLYWQMHFNGVVLCFLARFCKRVYQDVIIEYTNRVVSGMCRRDHVKPSFISRMTCCMRSRRWLEATMRGFTGRKAEKVPKSSLQRLRDMRWTDRFGPSRITQSVYLIHLCEMMFGEEYSSFVAPDRIAMVLSEECRHSKRKEGDCKFGWKRANQDLLGALTPKGGARAARHDDGAMGMKVVDIVQELRTIKTVLQGVGVRKGDAWKKKWKVSGRRAQLIPRLKAARLALASHRRFETRGHSSSGRTIKAPKPYGER